ncbi:MAG: hypothetical protein ACKPGN_26200, partial [Dolichospermum sp.]
VHLQKPVNPDLDTVLDKLLQKYYQDRYQSAQEVLQFLKTSQLTTKRAYQSSRKSSQVPSQQQNSPSKISSTQVKSKQNSGVPKSRISVPNNSSQIITWSSIGVFVLGTVFLGTQSEHIPIICKPLDNCAIDEEFSSKYKQSKDITVTAQKLFESAKNVEELRASQEQLQDAITQLKTIPTSAKIYNTAQKELSDYQSQLTKIQRRLDKENQAIDSINQAKQQAQDAEEQMGKANELEDYEAVKEKWDKVLAILNDIPSDVFISVTNLKNNYQVKKEKVVDIIGDLNKPTPSPEPTPTSTPTPDPTPSPTNYPTSTPAIEATNKSRREYVCKFLGFNQGVSQGVRLEPSISGSKTRDWDCFVPISSGRCVARGGGNVYEGIGETVGPTGLVSCDGDSITIEDPGTGEKYYQFNAVNGSVRFVLEK